MHSCKPANPPNGPSLTLIYPVAAGTPSRSAFHLAGLPIGAGVAGLREFSVVANGAVTSRMSGVPLSNGDPTYWISQGSYGPAPGAAYQAPWDTTRKEFVIEARFHYRIMGEFVGLGSTIGFNVSAHDDDDGGGRDAALYWKGVGFHNWQDEAGWGDVVLSRPETAVESTSFGEVKARRESGQTARVLRP